MTFSCPQRHISSRPNFRQMLVLYRTALDMLAATADERVLDLYGRDRHDLGRGRAPAGQR